MREKATKARNGVGGEFLVVFGRVGIPVGKERAGAGGVGFFAGLEAAVGKDGFAEAGRAGFLALNFDDVAEIAEGNGDGGLIEHALGLLGDL